MVAAWPEKDRMRLASTFKLRWNSALTTANGCCRDLDDHQETAVDGLTADASPLNLNFSLHLAKPMRFSLGPTERHAARYLVEHAIRTYS